MKKKAQSEIVGFGVIIIIVSVIILGFLYFSLSAKNDDFKASEESNAFIQSFLEYTSNCAKDYEPNYQPLRTVLLMCVENRTCYGDKSACNVLKSDLSGIMSASWQVGPDWPTKGYVLNITHRGEELFSLSAGNKTQNSRGSSQPFDGGTDVNFVIYG